MRTASQKAPGGSPSMAPSLAWRRLSRSPCVQDMALFCEWRGKGGCVCVRGWVRACVRVDTALGYEGEWRGEGWNTGLGGISSMVVSVLQLAVFPHPSV